MAYSSQFDILFGKIFSTLQKKKKKMHDKNHKRWENQGKKGKQEHIELKLQPAIMTFFNMTSTSHDWWPFKQKLSHFPFSSILESYSLTYTQTHKQFWEFSQAYEFDKVLQEISYAS